ncbi:MAG: hypothetical protein GY725_06090 [bacterium]|nr:hypothetical protein [bacterium]
MTLKAFGGPMDVVIEYEIVCSEEVYCRVAADIDGVPAGAWEVGPVRITTAGDRVRERFRIEKVGPGAVAGIIEVHAVIRDAGDRSPLDSSVAMFEIVEGTS